MLFKDLWKPKGRDMFGGFKKLLEVLFFCTYLLIKLDVILHEPAISRLTEVRLIARDAKDLMSKCFAFMQI